MVSDTLATTEFCPGETPKVEGITTWPIVGVEFLNSFCSSDVDVAGAGRSSKDISPSAPGTTVDALWNTPLAVAERVVEVPLEICMSEVDMSVTNAPGL